MKIKTFTPTCLEILTPVLQCVFIKFINFFEREGLLKFIFLRLDLGVYEFEECPQSGLVVPC